MKKLIITLVISISIHSLAQVGINKVNPTSTLDVNGSISAGFLEVTDNKTLDINNFYVTYANTSATQPTPTKAITLPSDSEAGRIYYIKNASNHNLNVVPANTLQTIRVGYANGVTSYTVEPGQLVKFIRSTNTSSNAWELSKAHNPTIQEKDIVLYATQLKIPPYNITSTNYANYNSNNWKLISATPVKEYNSGGDRVRGANHSTSGGRATIGFRAAILQLTYEYQGAKFNDTNLHPVLTTGNKTSNGISLVPSYAKIENVNGKTILKLSLARTDYYGVTAGTYDSGIKYDSEWTYTNSLLDVLLTRQMN